MITAKVIKDSVNPIGDRLTTLELEYPRYIHSEVMTHRVFSRNASSSRAIPVSTMIKGIKGNSVEPIFMLNQKGMAAERVPDNVKLDSSKFIWKKAEEYAIGCAEELEENGIHKQITNRLLEPFMHIKVILSGTSFSNFFSLRISPFAQQEINKLAIAIKSAMDNSDPSLIMFGSNEYHLPYLGEEEEFLSIEDKKRVSVARCARVSYYNHDGSKSLLEEDLALFNRLYQQKHMSPFEHIAEPMVGQYSNFKGFKSFRFCMEDRRKTNSPRKSFEAY